MDEHEWHASIMAGTRSGKLARVKPYRDPDVVSIWFLMEDEEIIFTSGENMIKSKNISCYPRAIL